MSDKRQVLMTAVTKDEPILWSEEPAALAKFRGDKILLLIFWALWTSIFLSGLFTSSGIQSGTTLIGIAFAAFGTFVTLSAFWDSFVDIFTVYAVTTTRLLIVRAHPFATQVESYYSTDIHFLKKIRKSNGSGHLISQTVTSGEGRRSKTAEIGFFGIDDVDALESLVASRFRSQKKTTE